MYKEGNTGAVFRIHFMNKTRFKWIQSPQKDKVMTKIIFMLLLLLQQFHIALFQDSLLRLERI